MRPQHLYKRLCAKALLTDGPTDGPTDRRTMGPKHSNRRIGEKKSLTHSPACSASLHSAALHPAPLHSALRAAPLAGSFVSEKVAVYQRDHMRQYAQIQPIVRRTDGPTDGRTDTPSYRDARTHLKIYAITPLRTVSLKEGGQRST